MNAKLPIAPIARISGVSSYISPRAMTQWDSSIVAKEDADRSISILDAIGQDYWTGEGVTPKRIAGALRALGKGDIVVNINSPGGDMFDGLAIYNMLREHDGHVTVRVLGLAASAASIIAMAGDTVEIARAGFLMIHNAWVVAQGNRNDLREYADTLEPFDRAMADIYAARTGEDMAAITKLMDAETWVGGSDAVERGFAERLLPSDAVEKSDDSAKSSSVRRIESALRASGLSKAEAGKLLADLKTPSAGDPAGNGSGEPAASMAAILAELQNFTRGLNNGN